MRLKYLKLKNFRGYRDGEITFSDLTAFVGKNDSGKSTILEALDVFFNDSKGVIKYDKEDMNITCGVDDVVISVGFDDLPNEIIIDATNKTTLADEYLLTKDGDLEIVKKFRNGSTTPKVYIYADHPQNPSCCDLLTKKSSDLKKIVKALNLEDVDLTRNAEMRQAIWNHYRDDLNLSESYVDISKEDAKKYWDKISNYLPIYSLFQADRKNSDNDSEVQDPLKHAVQEIIRSEELQGELDDIAERVLSKLREVASRTLDKLKEMDPETADTLKPSIPESKQLKWADVFKNVAIAGDEGIPVNKRGSGVRRLILLNFFRAEVDRRLEEKKNDCDTGSVIYAIEEPETSQHYSNQIKLIKAFHDLSEMKDVQVILTTHSGNIVKRLNFDELRFIYQDKKDGAKISMVKPNCLPYPSLNEVNFIAFDAATEEYHDELYGFLKTNNDVYLKYTASQEKMRYVREAKNGKIKEEQKSLTDYIRHQIHHPENKRNVHYTQEQLLDSINCMRSFINDNIDMIREEKI